VVLAIPAPQAMWAGRSMAEQRSLTDVIRQQRNDGQQTLLLGNAAGYDGHGIGLVKEGTMPNWNGPQPGPVVLRQMIQANLPQVIRIGIYNVRNVAGSSKQSLHAEGRAVDIYLNAFVAPERMLGDQLFAAFIECSASMGLEEVIWNRQIWSLTHRWVRPYTGVKPHIDHVHVGFTRTGSQVTSLGWFPTRLAQIRTELQDSRKTSSNIG
jgi:hypothetical protein